MSTLDEAFPGIKRAVPADLYIRIAGDDVINFRAEKRATTNADIDAVRAALTDAGFTESRSWIATEGMSWLSDGIQSVSLRVNPKPPTSPEE